MIENNFGKDGPYISASNRPTLHPICFSAIARFDAKVDLPTPPFALDIAIVYFVPLIGFLVKVRGRISPLIPAVFLSIILS